MSIQFFSKQGTYVHEDNRHLITLIMITLSLSNIMGLHSYIYSFIIESRELFDDFEKLLFLAQRPHRPTTYFQSKIVAWKRVSDLFPPSCYVTKNEWYVRTGKLRTCVSLCACVCKWVCVFERENVCVCV